MGMNTWSNPALSFCDHCKRRPRYNDGITVHPYCGRTCAGLARGGGPTNGNMSVPTSPVNPTNPFIATNPFVTANPFTPVNNFIATNPPNTTTPGNTANPLGTAASTNYTIPGTTSTNWGVPVPVNNITSTNSTNGSSVNQNISSAPACKTPGCSSPVYVDPNGVPADYCTKTHRQWGQHGCIFCREAPTDGVSVFCISCHNKALRMAPMIVEVPQDHRKYESVASQFRKKWMQNVKCPEVRAIYKIVGTAASLTKYEQYLNQVEAKHNFASQNKSRGNERRRWHGTTRKCTIGDKGVTTFCSDSSCALCCIMKTSFDLSRFARCGMFGAGIYTSSTSLKSNGYSRNGCTSNWKAMLLNKVVVGNGYKMTSSNSSLTEPPAGYDSVLAEAGAGLKYDELVVYNNDAIRPSYLLMYDAV